MDCKGNLGIEQVARVILWVVFLVLAGSGVALLLQKLVG